MTAQAPAEAGTAESGDGGTAQPGSGRRAAQRATDRNSVRIEAPLIGSIELPPTNELAFLGGVGVLAVMGVLEWPIAGALVAGHVLAANRRNKVLHDFGEALEEA